MTDPLCDPDIYWMMTSLDRPGAMLRQIGGEKMPAELKALVGVQQDPVWHPEGDAFQHTCHVLDAQAAILSREGVRGDERVTLMLAAVCHDLGKATTTRWNGAKGKWTAYGHDAAGVEPTRSFLARVDFRGDVEKVVALVRWHMAHTRKDFTPKAVRKLARELQPATIDDLLLLMEADTAGRPPAPPGLPPAVTEQLVPIARENGWLFGCHPADRRQSVVPV